MIMHVCNAVVGRRTLTTVTSVLTVGREVTYTDNYPSTKAIPHN